MSVGYHETRFSEETKRNVLWKTLWDAVFEKYISVDDCVVDLGAGYGQFINNVVARKRIAIDAWGGMQDHLDDGVEAMVGDISRVDELDNQSVDFAFASNIFEHLTQETVSQVLTALKEKLRTDGQLAILQPNYAYAYKEYFDDYTHISVWSHISLADFLTAHGFEVTYMHPRFLPLTIKSRLPVFPLLIKTYLKMPVRPLGKQMFFVARPKH